VHRKDLAVYGTGGLARTFDGSRWEHQLTDDPKASEHRAVDLPLADTVPFEHFAAVLRGEREPHPQLGPAFNLTVLEILDAARRSTASGAREPLER
jgi:predicted dehydrogenase